MAVDDMHTQRLLSGAVDHLNKFVLAGCSRSGAIACVLLAALAERGGDDDALGGACRRLSETLESLADMPAGERGALAPWVGAT